MDHDHPLATHKDWPKTTFFFFFGFYLFHQTRAVEWLLQIPTMVSLTATRRMLSVSTRSRNFVALLRGLCQITLCRSMGRKPPMLFTGVDFRIIQWLLLKGSRNLLGLILANSWSAVRSFRCHTVVLFFICLFSLLVLTSCCRRKLELLANSVMFGWRIWLDAAMRATRGFLLPSSCLTKLLPNTSSTVRIPVL